MNINFYCPRWGREEQPFAEFCKDVKYAGYDGVELPFPLDPKLRDSMANQLGQSGLKHIAQQWETVNPDISVHLREYENHIRSLALTQPEFISSQTGLDWFSFEQNMQIIALADKLSRELSVKILHETHRSKMMFAAHVTRPFLEALPNLRIVLDISHWCNVAATLLEDQEESVSLAISRTDHIHARVGFGEGPQVPNPLAPEWKVALQRHLSWWDTVVERARREDRKTLTITNEFGPFPYMPIEPYTAKPIADQWSINLEMKELLKKRYLK